MDNGAIDVTCVATHPILSGPAVQRLSEAPIKKVIVCDTLIVSEEKKFDKLEIVSVARVFGESIGRIDSGQSLSSMFHF
jgi:ribose-phosphate pyrophosphokinase